MSIAIISLLSGLAGMFGWGIYDFLGGVYSKQIGAFKSFFWSQLAGLISVLLLLFAITINFNIPILAIILIRYQGLEVKNYDFVLKCLAYESL